MTLSDFKRWLYRGQRPNWIARILNRAWATVASSGVASDYLVTLEVTGRKSGRTISLPVVIAIVDGAYLQRAPGARPHVPVNKDAALAEFQRVAAAFPVFRVGSNKTVQPTQPCGPRA